MRGDRNEREKPEMEKKGKKKTVKTCQSYFNRCETVYPLRWTASRFGFIALAELGSWPYRTRTRHTLYLVGHL
jgi:hypothetical protein